MIASILPAYSSVLVASLPQLVSHHKAGGRFTITEADTGAPVSKRAGLEEAVIAFADSTHAVYAERLSPSVSFPGFSLRGGLYLEDAQKLVPTGATVAIYGSRVAGYHILQSDLDVMFEGCSKEQAIAVVKAAVVDGDFRIDAAEGCTYFHLPGVSYKPVVLVGHCPELKQADPSLLSVAIRRAALGMYVPGDVKTFRFSTDETAGTERVDGVAQVKSAVAFAERRGMHYDKSDLVRRGIQVAEPVRFQNILEIESEADLAPARELAAERERAAWQAQADASSREEARCRAMNSTRG